MPVYLLIILISLFILFRLQGTFVALCVIILLIILYNVLMTNDEIHPKIINPKDLKRYQNYFIVGVLGISILIILLSI